MDTEDNVTLFVSHHSSKLDVAKAVETALAKRGVKCWIAPRDVNPGEPFDKSVRNAIDDSAAILLLFCAQSEKSRHVKRELILGDSAGRPIIPLRLEAIDPGELAYHLADSQWIDWIDRRDGVIDRVAAQAKVYAGAPDPAVIASPKDLPSSNVPAPDGNDGGPGKIPFAWIGLAAAALLAAVLITWMITGSGNEVGQTPASRPDNVEIAEAAPPEIDTGSDEPESPAPETMAPPTPQPTTTPPRTANPAASPAPAQEEQPAARRPAPTEAQPLQRVVQACAGVPSDTEYLICADQSLGDRAREMSRLIRQLRTRLESSPDALRQFNREQRAWFNNVRATCHSAACVAAEQTRWTNALRARLAVGS